MDVFFLIKTPDIFDNEDTLHTFLNLTEDKKEEFPCEVYKPKHNELFEEMLLLWNVNPNFEGCYMSDYKLLHNELEDKKTSWMDKYTTIIYSPNSNISSKRWKFQPLPDYMKWLKISELHYLPCEERGALKEGPWDEIPEIFVPTRILDLCYSLVDNSPGNLMRQFQKLNNIMKRSGGAWKTLSKVTRKERGGKTIIYTVQKPKQSYKHYAGV